MAIGLSAQERNLLGGRAFEALQDRLTVDDLCCSILYTQLDEPHLEGDDFIDSGAVYGALTGKFYSRAYVENPAFLNLREWNLRIRGRNENRELDDPSLYIDARKVTELGQRLWRSGEVLSKALDIDEDDAQKIVAHFWDDCSRLGDLEDTAILERVGEAFYAMVEENGGERNAIRACAAGSNLPLRVEVLPTTVLARLYPRFMELPIDNEIRQIAAERLNYEKIQEDFTPVAEFRDTLPPVPMHLNSLYELEPATTAFERERLVRATAEREQRLPEEEGNEFVAGAYQFAKEVLCMIRNGLVYAASSVVYLVSLIASRSFGAAQQDAERFLRNALI